MTSAARITQTAEKSESITVTGTVERVIFHAPDTGYSILKVRTGPDELTVQGTLPRIREGDEYSFTGRWVTHPKYGPQFKFDSYEVVLPTTKSGIVSYLTTAAYGVGPFRARKIVDILGEDCLSKIQEDPSCLDRVDFLTQKQREEIVSNLSENKDLAELTALICRASGVTPALAARIHAQYGRDAVRIVKENPYILADEMWGIGFIKADKVAKSVGIAPDSPFRLAAGVEYIIREAGSEGHCYLRPRDILRAVTKLLSQSDVGKISAAVNRLIEQGKLIREEDCIYPVSLHSAECELAAKMKILARSKKSAFDLEGLLRNTEEALGIEYAPKQSEAVLKALTNHLSIITGGPGTGKTTVTRGITMAYRILEPMKPIYLASPTGRAAKRLSEATGMEAQTIHRLLGFGPDWDPAFNDNEKLQPGLLVVDEFSMADLELAHILFRALPEDMQVVLIGDVDQLPSVGPGAVLRDSICSGVVPTTRLDFVYRQAAGSEIHLWAHLIKEGSVPNLVSGDDVTVVTVEEQEDAVSQAVEYAKRAAQEHGLMGFQVLAPMRRGTAGVNALNDAVRAAINDTGDEEINLKGARYRTNDKVMVIKNDYHLGVLNGDIGVVTDIIGPKEEKGPALAVTFPDGSRVTFNAEASSILTLAYAGTVHKSQGSEFPVVIVVLTRGHHVMLMRNLLYTAITRAKQHLVIIHQPGSIERAVRNNKIEQRFSRLAERLRG